jgi:hypothetical protein
MKNFVLTCTMLLLFAFSSEANKKKKKVLQTKTTKAVVAASSSVTQASSLMLCNADYGMPTWYLNMVKGFQFPSNFQAPLNYRLVTIQEKELGDYLKTIPFEKSENKIKVPIYSNRMIDCVEFTIERVTTMDSVLQAKYPDLMSFRIYEKANQLNAGRIDCDGVSTKMMLTYNQETFFVTPVSFNKKTYYACYSKNDPNFKKESFERN